MSTHKLGLADALRLEDLTCAIAIIGRWQNVLLESRSHDQDHLKRKLTRIGNHLIEQQVAIINKEKS
jgi:hypothetical protein